MVVHGHRMHTSFLSTGIAERCNSLVNNIVKGPSEFRLECIPSVLGKQYLQQMMQWLAFTLFSGNLSFVDNLEHTVVFPLAHCFMYRTLQSGSTALLGALWAQRAEESC